MPRRIEPGVPTVGYVGHTGEKETFHKIKADIWGVFLAKCDTRIKPNPCFPGVVWDQILVNAPYTFCHSCNALTDIPVIADEDLL